VCFRLLCFLVVASAGVAGCGGAHATTTRDAGRAPSGARYLTIEPPPGVRREGGTRLAEFTAGRTAFLQEGCVACHRVAGPQEGPARGWPLLHVGSRLSLKRIEHAMRDATAPMPRFVTRTPAPPEDRYLPSARFKAIAEFLSLVR
jgi:mono/diheme cytochrome c family protein